MAPIKSSLARSVGKLFGVQQDSDLSLRGQTQSSRVPPPAITPWTFAMFGGGGSGGAWVGGGGAGGGYVSETLDDIIKDTAFPFTIGAAGATPSSSVPPAGNGRGNSGGNSTFGGPWGTYTAYGGGGGGGNGQASTPVGPGIPGGSGGGAGGGSYNPKFGGVGDRQTGTNNSADTGQGSPYTGPQGNTGGLSQGDSGGGGGGAGGAGGNGDGSNGGSGGSAVTTTDFGPLNGTFGGGGGGCLHGGGNAGAGGGNAGDGVNTNDSSKNATGYANGGGGVREAGYAGGAATGGIMLIRVPDAYDTTIVNGGAHQVVNGGYRYIRLTAPGTITFIDA